MSFFLTIQIAMRALRKNIMRAALTVLGVVIGIAAVTTMVSIGQSAGQLVQNQIESLGTNVIIVLPRAMRHSAVREGNVHTLTAEDCDAINEECPAVLAASPVVRTSEQLIYRNTNWKPRDIFGVGPDYLIVRNWQLRFGHFFTRGDINAAENVCVIGQTIVAKLFQTTNPLGAVIRIKKIPFRVIGVLEEKGANLVGDDQDDVVLIPYSTVMKKFQESNFNNIHAIMASARTPQQMAEAEEQIRSLLQERHRIHAGESADFHVRNTVEIANILSIVTGTLTLMLAAIAGISLVVGGVGIMNIMLVSVTERTREIGIRMAVGAKAKDILRQFLVEAVLLSSIGGVIGVALGTAASVLAMMALNTLTNGTRWPVVISFQAAVIAMVFAAAVGMFFGYYPALRASRLDPIDALRYE